MTRSRRRRTTGRKHCPSASTASQRLDLSRRPGRPGRHCRRANRWSRRTSRWIPRSSRCSPISRTTSTVPPFKTFATGTGHLRLGAIRSHRPWSKLIWRPRSWIHSRNENVSLCLPRSRFRVIWNLLFSTRSAERSHCERPSLRRLSHLPGTI